jgi:hypothetical protein
MRLINTVTGELEEFAGGDIPRYAILSHTWDSEEVSFQDITAGTSSYKNKKGFQKIRKTCKLAEASGCRYAWVDTCCIDKSSSAELTEAINSMFLWYQRAVSCFAYLSDLASGADLNSDLNGCRWFTRGWTLQELIAPSKVSFYDCDWRFVGSKTHPPETTILLSSITGVPVDVLLHDRSLSEFSVAQRMSWAANRNTTRIEDTAYSLLGIFDVNMPLLYGEEQKAFGRLQEEIIKSGWDITIFAWKMPKVQSSHVNGEDLACGILAKSPLAFSGCAFQKLAWGTDSVWHRRDMSVSNGRVKLHASLQLLHRREDASTFLVLPLECRSNVKEFVEPLAIRLRCCGPEEYVRVNPWELVALKLSQYTDAPGLGFSIAKQRYFLAKYPENVRPDAPEIEQLAGDIGRITSRRRNVLQVIANAEDGVLITDMWPQGVFDPEHQAMFDNGEHALSFVLLSVRALHTLNASDPIVQSHLGDHLENWVEPVGLFDITSKKKFMKIRGRTEAILFGRYSAGYSGFTSWFRLVGFASETAIWPEAKNAATRNDMDGMEQLLERCAPSKNHKLRVRIPDTDFYGCISMTFDLLQDRQVCPGTFGRIEFKSTVETETGEPITQGFKKV